MSRRKSPRWVYVLAGAGLAVSLLVAGLALAASDGRLLSKCNFDQARWKQSEVTADPGSKYDYAGPEVSDLVKCDDLVYGKSRPEVHALLGPPTNKPRGSNAWNYTIGIPGGLLSDYPPLVIVFGEDGRVTDASVPGYVER
jgi:hypothetical protein